MAAGPMKVTDRWREANLKSEVDLDDDFFEHVLLGAGHTFARSNGLFSNISGDEIGDPDYARQQMTNNVIGIDGTKRIFTSDPGDFGTPVDITAKYHAIVHKSAGDGGALVPGDIVICVRDLNIDAPGTNPVASADGPFISRPHATDGWFYFDQPA